MWSVVQNKKISIPKSDNKWLDLLCTFCELLSSLFILEQFMKVTPYPTSETSLQLIGNRYSLYTSVPPRRCCDCSQFTSTCAVSRKQLGVIDRTHPMYWRRRCFSIKQMRRRRCNICSLSATLPRHLSLSNCSTVVSRRTIHSIVTPLPPFADIVELFRLRLLRWLTSHRYSAQLKSTQTSVTS